MLLSPAALRAEDQQGKSRLKFRPPGSKSSADDGSSRIRWGTERAKAAAKPATAAPTQTSIAGQAEQAKPPQTHDSEVIHATYTQDRYADRYADEQRVADDHFSRDDFFGGDTFGGTNDDPLPPPPRMFSTQDGGQQPPPVAQDPLQQQSELERCKTKEEMGIRSLTDISLSINVPEPVPHECPLFEELWQERNWAWVDFHWKASGICHKPLYFEDVTLERYGHSHGMFVQPFVSGAHFFAAIPVLPYKMGIHHPTECMYPLGYYRPGSCAPKLLYPLPLSWRGALYQGAASTGLVFLLP